MKRGGGYKPTNPPKTAYYNRKPEKGTCREKHIHRLMISNLNLAQTPSQNFRRNTHDFYRQNYKFFVFRHQNQRKTRITERILENGSVLSRIKTQTIVRGASTFRAFMKLARQYSRRLASRYTLLISRGCSFSSLRERQFPPDGGSGQTNKINMIGSQEKAFFYYFCHILAFLQSIELHA